MKLILILYIITMNWIWKILGYKDEDKELIKAHQLERARDYFAKQTAVLQAKHGKKSWSKDYSKHIEEVPPPLPTRTPSKEEVKI